VLLLFLNALGNNAGSSLTGLLLSYQSRSWITTVLSNKTTKMGRIWLFFDRKKLWKLKLKSVFYCFFYWN